MTRQRRQKPSARATAPAIAAAPIDRAGLRPEFWRRFPLEELPRDEWEALCDGCGKCCLIKLEDEDTGRLAFTSIACRLLDLGTCRCGNYALRRQLVPGCIGLDPTTLEEARDWLPESCAYRRLAEGRDLPDWHPLLTGDPESVHRAGASLRGRMTAEYDVDEDDWEDYVIAEQG